MIRCCSICDKPFKGGLYGDYPIIPWDDDDPTGGSTGCCRDCHDRFVQPARDKLIQAQAKLLQRLRVRALTAARNHKGC